MKLLCFDMDGVLFDTKNFWINVHDAFGTLDEGKKLTKELLYYDYEKLIEEVVEKLWLGKDAKPYYNLINNISYIQGVKDVFSFAKKNSFFTAIISASSIDLARRVQKDFDVDFIFANELVIKNGKVSGDFIFPVGHGKERKARIVMELLKKLNIPKESCTFIGDSENDIEAFNVVGKSISFGSKDIAKYATHFIDSKNLKDIIPFLK